MDPQTQFCPNLACPARGKSSKGNLVVHSRKEAHYKCTACGKTFAATTGTPFYRLRHSLDLITCVVTLIAGKRRLLRSSRIHAARSTPLSGASDCSRLRPG